MANKLYLTKRNLEIINPSVQATLQIMKSALAFGYDYPLLINIVVVNSDTFRKNVKRIIYTSSTSTIKRSEVIEPPEPVDKLCTEEDWNDGCLELVQKLGRDALPSDKYQASKVLAEKGKYLCPYMSSTPFISTA